METQNDALIKKLKKNAENQNIEINKLSERNKILQGMIKDNFKSIQELRNQFIDMLNRRCC